MGDRGTKPSSSMISRPRRDRFRWKFEQPSLVPGLHQLVDQGGGGGEAHRHTPLAGGQSQTQGDVGLAGAAVANGDDILPPLDVFAPRQLHDQGFVHRGDGWEVERVQALHRGEAGRPDPELDHALYAERDLCQAIVSHGRDYLVRIKGNQPEVRAALADGFAGEELGEPQAETLEKSGRDREAADLDR